ncbi:ABC transporter substrate-binding protein [Micromonospora arborensis]|uniref:ABC transporter substrate-binding protein n=1 Tax=Micromonospora arborensis TaxID=2116518 RepID=UPI00341383A0
MPHFPGPVALLSATILTLVTACSGAVRQPTGQAGGRVVFATDKEPECFDTQVSQSDISGVLMRNVFDSLVSRGQDGEFKPWLASKWSLSADELTYTFTLREGVKFSDGTPFDAAAVKANYDRIVAPATKSKYAAGLLGPYAGTTVVDPLTVAVRFTRPFASFLSAASTSYLGIRSPKAIAADLCAGSPAQQVGTGPFLFASYTRGQQVVLTRNPSYNSAPATAAHTGPANLSELVFRFVAEDTVRVGSVTSGQADIADRVPPNQVGTLKNNATVQLTSSNTPGLGYQYFLNTQSPLFADRRVRLAVQQAFDVDRAVKAVYFGEYERAWSPLSPATEAYDASLVNSFKYDPAAAAVLLDQAGYTGRDAQGFRTKAGHRLTATLLYVPLYTPEDRRTLDQALQGDLKKVGIELKLVPMEAAAYEPVRNAGEYDVIAFAWGGSNPDLLRTMFDSKNFFDAGGNNASRLTDRAVDDWLAAAAASTDPVARKDLYGKAQRRIIDEGVSLPTAVSERQLAVRSAITGLTFDANGWPLFYDVERS